MKNMKALLLVMFFLLSGCTGKMSFKSLSSGGTTPEVGDPAASNPGNSEPTPTTDVSTPSSGSSFKVVMSSIPQPVTDPQVAIAKIQEIQQTLHTDPQYSFDSGDTTLLQAEGLSTDAVKGWVQ